MFDFSKYVVCILMLGVIDQVQGRSVLVELSASDGTIENMEMPIWMF